MKIVNNEYCILKKFSKIFIQNVIFINWKHLNIKNIEIWIEKIIIKIVNTHIFFFKLCKLIKISSKLFILLHNYYIIKKIKNKKN